jgi:hypothetical protein
VRHRERERFAARFPCHVTLKIREGLPSLRTKRVVREIEQSLAPACERGSFRIVHYSIQMKSLAARFARAVNRALARRGPVLAERYHLRVLRSPRQVRNALAYVLLNARRHLAKRRGRSAVRGEALDPASSSRWFDGWAGRRTAPARGSPPVSTPHTWMLRVGWRRHGLISPAEVPGLA